MNNDQKKNQGVNPLAAGAVGVVVGAGAVAAVTTLRDEKTRKQAKKLMGTIGKQAAGYVTVLKKEVDNRIKDTKKATTTKKRDMKRLGKKTADAMNRSAHMMRAN